MIGASKAAIAAKTTDLTVASSERSHRELRESPERAQREPRARPERAQNHYYYYYYYYYKFGPFFVDW